MTYLKNVTFWPDHMTLDGCQGNVKYNGYTNGISKNSAENDLRAAQSFSPLERALRGPSGFSELRMM